MKDNKFWISVFIFFMLLPCLYGGCVIVVSTGDKSNDRDKKGNGTFIGITAQASLNSENTADLAWGAFAGGLDNPERDGAGAVRISENLQSGSFRPLCLPIVLSESIRRIGTPPKVIDSVQRSLPAESDRIESGRFSGSCGGSLSFLVHFDMILAEFSGSLIFEDFCEQGVTLSGDAAVNGIYDPEIEDILTADFTFDRLTDGHFTLDGEIAVDFTDSPLIATFTALGRDDRSGKIYWIKDYGINVTESTGHLEIELFGEFYHPDHGFVTLTTAEPFIVHDEDDWPTSGILTIEGKDHTRAQLIVRDPSSHHETAFVDDGDVNYLNSVIFNRRD